jgi:hypothetical protein
MYSASETSTANVAEANAAIWNPVAAACWSLMFTPAFGAYLLMRNWETLGEARQAATARLWFVFSLGLLVVQLLSGAINQRLGTESHLLAWINLLYLLVWCLGAALPQARLLQMRFGTAYPRKRWDQALLCAVIAGIAYLATRAFLNFLLHTAT